MYKIYKNLRYFLSLCTLFIFVLCVITAGGAVFFAPDLEVLAHNSGSVTTHDGTLLAASRSADDKIRLKTLPQEVDPLFLKMLMASEDQRFYLHLGVDPLSLVRALISNIRENRTVSGASTLAMQAVRSLDHRPRTLANKIREAFGALFITLFEGRDRVLEIWLTRASFGADVEGVKAASLRWFGHMPDHMTPDEAALLVALPRAPENLRPDRHAQNAQKAVADVLRLCREKEVLSPEVSKAVTASALPDAMHALPSLQPGLCQRLFLAYPGQDLTVSLETPVQSILQNRGRIFRASHDPKITAAAVVLDRETGRITGFLGSAVPVDSQLPLPLAVRSPGSALKPFAYALAFEQHILHPKSILSDEKTFYGTWVPKNYSGLFQGKITAAKALIYSLNLPALAVLDRIDPENFTSRFLDLGLKLPKGVAASPAVILGGCGIDLLSLTALYAALADDGLYRSYGLFEDDENTRPQRILSRAAARATSEILEHLPPPAGFTPISGLSYKTGTSRGSRDAFAVGSLGKYTVGIWCGRPDGKATSSLTGFKDAAPMLYGIMQDLSPAPLKKIALDEKEALSADAPPLLADLSSESNDDSLLRIEFPQTGSLISPGIFGTVRVSIKGGVPPYYLSVNGRSCPDSTEFEPKLYDFEHNQVMRIDVTDSKGNGDSIMIKVAEN